MKRCFKLIIVMFTLVLTFSACTKGETDYTLLSFESEVSSGAESGQFRGKLCFLSGDEISLTLTEPSDAKNCVFELKEGDMSVSYEGVRTDIKEDSPIGRLFLALKDFACLPRKIKSKGIITFEGATEFGKYELKFDCEAKKIKEVCTDTAVYIFL